MMGNNILVLTHDKDWKLMALFTLRPSVRELGERLNGMIGLSLNAREFCILHLV